MKLLKLNLEYCINKGDETRIEKGLKPIKSIRELAFELEFRWPETYNSDYIRNRLHRANNKGIGKFPNTLISDILEVLNVNFNDLVEGDFIEKKRSKPCNECFSIFYKVSKTGEDYKSNIVLSNEDQKLIQNRRLHKKYRRNQIKNLTGTYIKEIIKRKTGLQFNEIENYPELIKTQRLILEIKRLTK